MKNISIYFFAILLNSHLFGQLESNSTGIIPTPFDFNKKNEVTKTVFTAFNFIDSNISTQEIEIANQWLSNSFKDNISKSTKYLNIAFVQLESPQISDDSDYYEIIIENDTAFISFTSNAGRLFAMSSIIQSIEVSDSHYTINSMKIRDYGIYKWRGLHLDVCRHFFTVEEVKRFIDIMAFYKFNKFHWHLTDDQAWRIEIKKYPRLTEVGAFRDSTLIGAYVTNPTNWDLTPNYGGYYTQEQIKEVVQFAKLRNVTIVPEIEMPGHARAALAAYPNLGCTGKRPPLIGYWGVFDEIFCSNEKTISFLQDVLTEVLELFPSEYIHIGGDEAPKTQWKACEVCQQTIKLHALKDEHELQSWFVRQMDQFLTSRGRKLLGWDEILEGGLSPNAAVMSWQGYEGGLTAASHQHEVVMTPNSFCYFDYYQGNRMTEPHSIGGYVPLEKVYGFNPIPSKLDLRFHQYILGAQANLWTEYIKTFDHVTYMVYPRAFALIQNLWGKQNSKPSYPDFLNTILQVQLPILANWNINYSTSFANPQMEVETTSTGIQLKFHADAGKIVVNTDANDNNQMQLVDCEINLNRIEASVPHYINYHVKNETFDRTISYPLLHHKGLGLTIKYMTQPHPSYAKNKEINLVNGIQGNRPWMKDEWVGFNSKEIQLLIDLDSKINYTTLTLSLLDSKGSWIHLPQKIELYGQKKNGNWKLLYSTVNITEMMDLPISKKVSTLKLKIETLEVIPEGLPGTGTTPFTFIDELILK